MTVLKKYNYVLLLGVISLFIVDKAAFAQIHQGCYGYLTEMVRSSNFPVREVGKDKINLLIDDDQPNMISAQVVYDIIPKSVDQNTFAFIGWIKYDVKKHILSNNSAELNEHPVRLTYNRKYAVSFDQCCKNKK